MPARPCLGPPGATGCPGRRLVAAAARRKSGTRCAECQRVADRVRHARRGDATAAYTRHVREARAAWVAAHGQVCAGCHLSAGRPHPCTVGNPLTMDHVPAIAAGGDLFGPLVGRCRTGNSAAGARTRRDT